jgi:hypothetical protein
MDFIRRHGRALLPAQLDTCLSRAVRYLVGCKMTNYFAYLANGSNAARIGFTLCGCPGTGIDLYLNRF